MAMNKAEKARLEEALTQAALRWTQPVAADVPAPSHSSRPDTSTGYSFNSYNLEAVRAWSTSIYHGYGAERTKYSGTQGSRALYSTRLLALQAMRYEVEQECAKKLRQIDKLIEAERNVGASDD